ncbi:MAG: retroviral-like aspartic protease family protein [Planctomycetes bacterium]|jgi:predicted aspartyl protease|nr:retroviral-like aspartic protease family protein [Planctomycetota bacterium]
MHRSLWASCLVILLVACSRPAAPTPEVAELALLAPTIVPIVDELRPMVTATADGRAIRALVDSGADGCQIDAATATALQLPLRPYANASKMYGSTGHSVLLTHYVEFGELRLGELRLGPVRLPVVEADYGPASGILVGQDLLSRVVTLFDQGQRRLHILPKAADDDAIVRYIETQKIAEGAWAKVEADFRPCPHLRISLPNLDEPIEIGLDTGAASTGLPLRAIEALGLTPLRETYTTGVGGRHDCREYHTTLDLFGLAVSLDVHDLAIDKGLLGMDVLSLFVVVLDGPGKKVWLHHRAK